LEYDKHKSRSPNSIHFYLKKFDGDESLANEALSKYRKDNFGKILQPSTTKYWITKFGMSKEEAEIKVVEHQTKTANSPRVNNPYDGEINNHIKRGLTKEEALELTNNRRRIVSPRRKEYWTNLGFTEEESVKYISNFQKKCSPRSIEYWLNIGYSKLEALELLSKYQDNLSIESIINRENITTEEAINLQLKYRDNRDCINLNNEETYGIYLLYRYKVYSYSDIIYKAYKSDIDPFSLRGQDNHLDHIFSVKDGFYNNVPIKIIGSKYNLRIISKEENIIKRDKSHITYEKLIELYTEGEKCQYQN